MNRATPAQTTPFQTTPSTQAFLAARHQLLSLRGDPVAASAQFRWPQLTHFDAMARGNDAAALWVVDANGTEERFSFAQLSARSNQVPKFEAITGVFSRICVGAPQPGWVNFDGARAHPVDFNPLGSTLATDRMLLYFTSGTTSGTTAQPKLVLHTHQRYPVGHLSTMYWLGLRAGDVHLNISSPGWVKHAWSCFFAPWSAGACVFIHNTPRFSAQGLLAVLERCRVTSLCAPPTVWRMLIQEDLAVWQGRLALREVIGAGEPLNPEIIEQVRKALGLTLRDLTFVGRADDVFKASGYRISPFELESALIEHEAVVEVELAVVQCPDPVRTAVPKTISGKIRRVQLRAQEVERQAAGARGAGEFFEGDFPNLRLDD